MFLFGRCCHISRIVVVVLFYLDVAEVLAAVALQGSRTCSLGLHSYFRETDFLDNWKADCIYELLGTRYLATAGNCLAIVTYLMSRRFLIRCRSKSYVK